MLCLYLGGRDFCLIKLSFNKKKIRSLRYVQKGLEIGAARDDSCGLKATRSAWIGEKCGLSGEAHMFHW